jgi:nucleotide-binding universal stress UspA family protein
MIVCGTDFSPAARAAATVAAHLSVRAGTSLELLCATGDRDTAAQLTNPPATLDPSSRAGLLQAEVARVLSLGVSAEGSLDASLPDRALALRARDPGTSLLVLGAVGHTFLERVLLGSVAERVAMESIKPVLVVRDERAWSAWVRSERPLRVLVAFDVGASASRALEWVAWLQRCGELRVTICWVVNPALENQRFGATGEGAGVELLPKTRESLWREFQTLVGAAGKFPSAELRLEPTLGRVDSALTSVASTLEQDLLVVGSHQRHGFERLWQTSVSRGVLRHAAMSVAVIPHLPGA